MTERERLYAELFCHIEHARERVRAEIAIYPQPITGCDAQFNHLLEERRRLDAEARRLRAAYEACDASGSIEPLEAWAERVEAAARSLPPADEVT